MKKIQVSKTGEVSCLYIKTTNHKSIKKQRAKTRLENDLQEPQCEIRQDWSSRRIISSWRKFFGGTISVNPLGQFFPMEQFIFLE